MPSLNDVDSKESNRLELSRREMIKKNLTAENLSKVGEKFKLNIDPKFESNTDVGLILEEFKSLKTVRIADVEKVRDEVNYATILDQCSKSYSESADEAEEPTPAQYIADMGNCNAFLVCDHGKLYRFVCGNETAWNAEELTCDFKSKLNCTDNDILPRLPSVDDNGLEDAELEMEKEVTTRSTTMSTISVNRVIDPRRNRKQISYSPSALDIDDQFPIITFQEQSMHDHEPEKRPNLMDYGVFPTRAADYELYEREPIDYHPVEEDFNFNDALKAEKMYYEGDVIIDEDRSLNVPNSRAPTPAPAPAPAPVPFKKPSRRQPQDPMSVLAQAALAADAQAEAARDQARVRGLRSERHMLRRR